MPRIMINVSDDEYKSLLEKSREMHYPLSTLLRMVVTGLIAWNYKTTNSAQNIYSNNQAPISERLNGLAQNKSEFDYGWGPGIPMTHAQYLLDGGQLGEQEWLAQGTPKGPRR